MAQENHDYLQKILQHINILAEQIGPRPATQPKEKEAAGYVFNELVRMGYRPQSKSFKSAKSIYHPHLLASLMTLSAFVIYPLAGRVSAAIAAALSIIALVSDLLELAFITNPFRWIIPKGLSQNVHATLEPRGEHAQDLILVGHLDTHQAGKIFSSRGWVNFFQTFTTIAFVTFSAQVAFFLAGILAQWTWLWIASIPSAISALILFAICYEADRAPFSPGANDNASAVAMVLAFAESLKHKPFQHTRVWFLFTGCEEVQHYGMIHFIKSHKKYFRHPKFLIFEMVGVAGPSWETKEGIVIPFKPDKKLVGMVEKIAEAHPELGAYPSFIIGGNSEMADAVRAGYPAITFFGLTPDGCAPYWHQLADTADKIDPDVLDRTYRFSERFITDIDKMHT